MFIILYLIGLLICLFFFEVLEMVVIFEFRLRVFKYVGLFVNVFDNDIEDVWFLVVLVGISSLGCLIKS